MDVRLPAHRERGAPGHRAIVAAVTVAIGVLVVAGSASAQSVRAEPATRSAAPVAVAELAPDAEDPPLRVMGELGAAFATLFALQGLGALIGAGAAPSCDPSSPCASPLVEILSGVLIGAVLGAIVAPVFVTLAGDANGGRGDVGGAYIGWLVGLASAALTVGLGYLAWQHLDATTGNVALIGSIALGGTMIVGAPLIGYEGAHARARRRGRVAIMPTLLGVAGTF